MERFLDPILIQDFVLGLRDWFSLYVLALGNLVQILFIAAGFIIARITTPRVQKKHLEWLAQRDQRLLPGTIHNTAHSLLFPALWLIFIWFCKIVANAIGWPGHLLNVGVSLLAAWIVIRFTATLVRNPFLAKIIAVTAWTLAALNMLNLLAPTLAVLDRLAINIGNFSLSVLTLLKGFIYLAVFLWAANLISRIIEVRLYKSSLLTPSIRVLTVKLIKIVLLIIAFLLAISSVGIDLTVFAVFGGALGVGIGFGLQKGVSNFVSGIFLLLDKSIKPGDIISVGETYGWVNSLNARYVSLDTPDGIEHLIPNEELISQRVENWSYSNNRIRLSIPVGIHYQSDVRRAMELCLEAAVECERVLTDPQPACLLVAFGESSVDLVISLWIEDPMNGIGNVKSQILLAVWDKFHANQIEIPYPQRELHIKTPIHLADPDTKS